MLRWFIFVEVREYAECKARSRKGGSPVLCCNSRSRRTSNGQNPTAADGSLFSILTRIKHSIRHDRTTLARVLFANWPILHLEVCRRGVERHMGRRTARSGRKV